VSIEIPGKTIAFMPSGSSSAANNPRQDQTKISAHADSSSNKDKMNVTPMANKLSNLTKQISAESLMDAHRINSIKHEIEQGSYVVNSNRVAEKFFRFEFALHR